MRTDHRTNRDIIVKETNKPRGVCVCWRRHRSFEQSRLLEQYIIINFTFFTNVTSPCHAWNGIDC